MAATGKLNWLALAYGFVLTSLFVISCATVAQPPLPNPTQPINSAITTTKDVQTKMGATANDIDFHVAAVRKDTPVANIPQVAPHLDGINTDTATIRTLETQLNDVQSDLTTANSQVKAVQSSNTSLTKQVATLTAEKKSALRNLMIWVILLSVVGVGVAVALVFEGNVWAISLGVGCLVTLGLAIFITQYAVWFAVGAAVLCLGGLGYLIYQRFATTTTSTQLAKTVEAAKMGMTDSARLSIFGNGPLLGQSSLIQNSRTINFVKRLRASKDFDAAPPVAPVSLIDHSRSNGMFPITAP